MYLRKQSYVYININIDLYGGIGANVSVDKDVFHRLGLCDHNSRVLGNCSLNYSYYA